MFESIKIFSTTLQLTPVQIRGVASKQLVHDQTKTLPATFLSFQQVLCSVPALDIHSNKERHRFDLRDNTDQTRYSQIIDISNIIMINLSR